MQAPKCNFGSKNDQEDNIIDQMIKGTCHGAVRKQLFDQDPSNLNLDFARTYETTQYQLKQLGHAAASNISTVQRNPNA